MNVSSIYNLDNQPLLTTAHLPQPLLLMAVDLYLALSLPLLPLLHAWMHVHLDPLLKLLLGKLAYFQKDLDF